MYLTTIVMYLITYLHSGWVNSWFVLAQNRPCSELECDLYEKIVFYKYIHKSGENPH